jgi:predicted outer membrane repeat protein
MCGFTVSPSDTTICAGDSATLRAINDETEATFKWYDSQTGGTLLYTGNNYTVFPASTTNYYVSKTILGTESERTEVRVILMSRSIADGITITGNTEICYGMNTVLNASAANVTNPIYRWYNSQTEVTPFYTSSSYTTSNLTSDTTFYVSVEGNNYCENDTGNRKSVMLEILRFGANGKVYVTKTGAGNKDGSSWANACAGLAVPLVVAQKTCSGIKEIWVARGIYHPLHKAGSGTSDKDNSFVLVAGVKIYGGFAGTETLLSERNLAQNPSILSGDNSYHTVISAGSMISGTDTARLDGFVIRNGKANDSGTITVNGQSISANSGGGIYFANSAPNIVNVEIKGSEASASGGGIYANNSSPKLINVVVSGNLSASGGGIYLNGGSPALTNITVSGNIAATSGGGIYMNSSSPQIGNSIVWGNAAGSNNNVYSTSGSPAYQYSLIQDLNPSGAGNMDGTNPSNDPVFVLPIPASNAPTIDGDYRLQLGSPVLNAGNNALNREPTDIESNPRIQESKIELGAYEVNYNFECNCE